MPLRPYFESRTNVIVTGGAVGVKGRVAYGPGGASAGRFTYAGDVTISDFGSLDRPTSQELMRWKSLTLTGVDAASEPFKLALGGVALDRFYARLILNSDATLNIAQLLAPPRADANPQAQITKGPGVATRSSLRPRTNARSCRYRSAASSSPTAKSSSPISSCAPTIRRI